MSQLKKLQPPDENPPQQKMSIMQAYQFDCHVDASRTITLELPADAPVGLAQIIVLFPDATKH